MESIILAVHVLLAAAIIALVMLQQGKGAEAGASFGAGASQTVFGSQGSGSFLARATAVMAACLFATSFALAYFAKEQAGYVSEIGIPSAAMVQQAEQSALPDLGELLPAPTDSDIPSAN
ncbi:MAG: preprotein translocase subunit SecG [Oceanospirillaceae bacterium]|nr:preprotein translocase subunit SecG [Oceanospirillaceae bacterium]